MNKNELVKTIAGYCETLKRITCFDNITYTLTFSETYKSDCEDCIDESEATIWCIDDTDWVSTTIRMSTEGHQIGNIKVVWSNTRSKRDKKDMFLTPKEWVKWLVERYPKTK